MNKDGPIVYFERDDGEKGRYDFRKKLFYKESTGNWIKGIQTFFRGYRIKHLRSEDETFDNFLRNLARVENRCKNIGTYIERIFLHDVLEKWSNYDKVDFEWHSTWRSGYTSYYFPLEEPPSFYPKNILNIFHREKIIVTKQIENEFQDNRDKAISKYMLVDKIARDNYLNYKNVLRMVDSRDFGTLIREYGYNFNRLTEYLAYITTTEGVDEYTAKRELCDYARMMSLMHPNRKWKKYPKMLLSVHQITSRNFEEKRKEIDAEMFANAVESYSDLAYDKDSKYVILLPKTDEDLIFEGSELSHCVGSYRGSVAQMKTCILFVRKKKEEEEPYMTIEVKDGKLVHAQKRFRAGANEEEKNFLKKFCRVKKLEYGLR